MPTYTEVILSDGKPASVRHLTLFELDDLPTEVPDDYTYTVEMLGGNTYEIYFDFSKERPKPPGVPEDAKEGTPEFYMWQDFLRQEEGRRHQLRKYDAYTTYVRRIRDYIISNCLEDEIEARILIPRDWEKIYQAAFSNLVTQEDIARALRANFQR